MRRVKGDKLFSGLDSSEGSWKEEQVYDLPGASVPRDAVQCVPSVCPRQLDIRVSGSGEVTGWRQSLGENLLVIGTVAMESEGQPLSPSEFCFF